MARPFRFGVQLSSLPPGDWVKRARRIEELGYSTVFWPDHFGSQWDPIAALAAVAAVTEQLNVGSLVYDNDYRHPVVHAKAAATTHVLSGGRHEFGIGAGWMRSDYEQAGIAYDPAGVRVSRLEEALEVIRSMWDCETTTFHGEHYHVEGIARAADLPEGQRPKLIIGGGRPKVLSLAGRYADIVGINPSMHEGRVTMQTALDHRPARVREKVRCVREAAEAAGRDPDSLELQALVFVVALVPDATALRQGLAHTTGMSEADVADCPLFLTGSPDEVRESIYRWRSETGISYIVIQGDDHETVERFAADVVAPLSGT